MAVKAMDLFDAYRQAKLPMDEGYIVTSFFKVDTPYSIYEIISYSAVKDLYQTGNGLTFQTSGKKIFVLAEPATYRHKQVEPYVREKEFLVPLRFSEAEIITTKNQAKIMFNKEPQMGISSFTVVEPAGIDFAFLFYAKDDVFESIEKFFAKSLNNEASIPQYDAKRAAKKIAQLCKENLTWQKEEI